MDMYYDWKTQCIWTKVEGKIVGPTNRSSGYRSERIREENIIQQAKGLMRTENGAKINLQIHVCEFQQRERKYFIT